MNIGIGLTAKGSINNLHRMEIVESFYEYGVQTIYLVPNDILFKLDKIKLAQYQPIPLDLYLSKINHTWLEKLRYFRRLYTSTDPAKIEIFNAQNNSNFIICICFKYISSFFFNKFF